MASRTDNTVVVPFSVRIEQNRSFKHDQPVDGGLPLTNFDGKGADLLQIIDAFVRDLFLKRLIKRDTEHFGCTRDVVRHSRTISFDMDGGVSGRERRIRLHQGASESLLQANGVMWSNYKVYCAIPKNAIVGWVLVEKDGVDTIPVVWRTELIKLFRQRYPKYKLIFAHLKDDALWAHLERQNDENNILDIKVNRRAESSRAEDNTRGFPTEVVKDDVTVYSVPNGKMNGWHLRRIRRFFTRSKGANGIVEIDLDDRARDEYQEGLDVDLREGVHEITVRARVNGRPKSIRFSGLGRNFETYPIEGLEGARVSRDKFRSECRGHVVDLASLSGVRLDQGWDTGEWERSLEAPLEVPIDDRRDS